MNSLLDPSNAYSGVNLVVILVLVLLSAIFFICFSGFVKYNIVLNIIKNAIGTQQIPPTIVVNLLASLMALNGIWSSISPGLERIKPYFEKDINKDPLSNFVDLGLGDAKKEKMTMSNIVSQWADFFPELLEHAKNKTAKLKEIVDLPFNFDTGNANFKYLLANLIYDIYKGFELGLKLYIIFVSIDFLVAVVLSGVGMNMLSPTVISTPIKLAIFYFSDSWTIMFNVIG